ncbi:hypothetical protein ACQY0O_003676 [Thecaphora frezii]
MGQRAIHLNFTYIVNDASVTYTVNALPATKQIARLFVPGPAILFVTIGGVPSIGSLLMVGNKRRAQVPVPFTIAYGSALQTLAAPISSTKFTADLSTHNSSSSSWSITKIATSAGAGAAPNTSVSTRPSHRPAARSTPAPAPPGVESAHTCESYRMPGVGESPQPLAGGYDQPQGGSRGHGDQSSPLSYNPSSGAPHSQHGSYQQLGWGEL